MMAELTLEQHKTLGGSFSTDAFFGGFITSQAGLYVPGKSEQVSGNHYAALANFTHSIATRLGAVSPVYVYKDSTDATNQFSVKELTYMHRGIPYSTFGGVNQGPLTAGATNYIWLALETPWQGHVTFGVAPPSYLHIMLATIAMPASGHWLPEHLTILSGRYALSATGSTRIKCRIDHSMGSGTFVGVLPAGAVVYDTKVVVTTAFNNSSTLIVGDSGDVDRLVQAGDLSILTTGAKVATRPYEFSVQTDIEAAWTGSPTQGAAIILMEYWI